MENLQAMLEAMIFVSKEPLSVEKMVEALQAADINIGTKEVNHAIKDLVEKWQDPDRPVARGLQLKRLAGGFVLASAVEQANIVKKLVAEKPVQLSKGQLEVLSIVAYRQPLTRVDIDEIRGVDSSFALKRLMQLKLLKILGKSEGLGRPLLYGTSKDFLEFFSLNSLNDLPTLKQYDALGAGEELSEIDVDGPITLKDLFAQNSSAMFSDEVERQSDEALKSLDEAMSRVDSVEKTSSE